MSVPLSPLDAYNNAFGGLSLLLESDLVMSRLGEIEIDPSDSTGSTMADLLTSVASNFADLRAHVEGYLRES